MGCVIFDKEKNKNYGLINMNQNNINLNNPANNNFIYSRNISLNNRNNNININNNRNNNRYNNNRLHTINNRRNNRQNTNNNNNINNNRSNSRTHTRNSDRINTENNRRNNRNNILNDILNYSFENNSNRNNNENNSRNIIENGNEYFIPAFRQTHSIINNNRSRLFRRNINGSTEPRPRKRCSSFKKNLLKNIPEITIKDFTKLEEGKKRCMICLEDFIPKIKVKVLPCLHFFHPTCIEKWIQNKQFCPICKFYLTEKNLREKNYLLTS